MKWRNSKERELLSTGGSREATLPSKDNPNPDLSDINEESEADSSMTQPDVLPETEVLMNSEPLDLRDAASHRIKVQDMLEQDDMFCMQSDVHMGHLHDTSHMDSDSDESDEEEIHVS